jgi:hypothetical protein
VYPSRCNRSLRIFASAGSSSAKRILPFNRTHRALDFPNRPIAYGQCRRRTGQGVAVDLPASARCVGERRLPLIRNQYRDLRCSVPVSCSGSP